MGLPELAKKAGGTARKQSGEAVQTTRRVAGDLKENYLEINTVEVTVTTETEDDRPIAITYKGDPENMNESLEMIKYSFSDLLESNKKSRVQMK